MDALLGIRGAVARAAADRGADLSVAPRQPDRRRAGLVVRRPVLGCKDLGGSRGQLRRGRAHAHRLRHEDLGRAAGGGNRCRGCWSAERLDAAAPLTVIAAVDGADGHRRRNAKSPPRTYRQPVGRRCPALGPAERRRPCSPGIQRRTHRGHRRRTGGVSFRGCRAAPPAPPGVSYEAGHARPAHGSWSACLRATVLPAGRRAVMLPASAAAPAR